MAAEIAGAETCSDRAALCTDWCRATAMKYDSCRSEKSGARISGLLSSAVRAPVGLSAAGVGAFIASGNFRAMLNPMTFQAAHAPPSGGTDEAGRHHGARIATARGPGKAAIRFQCQPLLAQAPCELEKD
jgi:hypothetical protein